MNPIEKTKELLNIINNMEFKGNPIRAGKLSKKYLEVYCGSHDLSDS